MKPIPHTELKTHHHSFDTAVTRALRGAALAGAASALLLTLGCTKKPDEMPTASNPPQSSQTPAADAGAKAGTVVDDSVITSKVKTAFLTEDNLKSMDISVETVRGAVTLTGMVDSQAQIDNAVRVARATEGTQSVQNLMTVKQ